MEMHTRRDLTSELKLISAKVRLLNEKGVRFNGANVNKAMLTGILIFQGKVSAKSLACLERLERKHGQTLLTGGYHKITRLSQVCTSYAEKLSESWEWCIEWILHCLEWQLKFEMTDARQVTIDFLDKDRQGGLGFLHAAIGRFAIHRHIQSWVVDLGNTSTEAAKTAVQFSEALELFQSYTQYEKTFAQNSLEETGEDAVAEVKVRFPNKTSHLIIDFCYDLLSGVHDEPIKQTIKAADSIAECKWVEIKEVAALREVYRQLNQHRQVIDSIKEDAMPPIGSRTMRRHDSECAEDGGRAQELSKERAEAWRLAQAARKKLVHVGCTKVTVAGDVQRAFEKSPAFTTFKGKPGEQHRVFIFSAELFLGPVIMGALHHPSRLCQFLISLIS